MLLDDLRQLVAGLQDPSTAAQGPTILPSSPSGGGFNLGQSVGTQAPSALPQAAQTPAAHHGLFGIHGTLRDILGTLGDAFLVQSGNKPVYDVQRTQEKEGDALQGLTTDPLGAIQRYTAENPRGGLEAYDKYIQEARMRRTADQTYQGDVTDRALRLVRSATPQSYPAVKERALSYLAARGVTLPFDLPDTYDKDAIENMSSFAVPVKDQVHEEDLNDWRDNQMGYRHDVLDERGQYHKGVLAIGGVRANNDTRRTDQGDIRTDNDTRRTDQGVVRTANDTRRTDQSGQRVQQGQDALDMRGQGVYSGRHRPIPGPIVHNPITNQIGYKRADHKIVDMQGHVLGTWTDK